MIRSPRAGSQAFLNEVRETVWSVDPNVPLANVHTMGYFYTKSMARTSFTLVMLGVAGGMALLLGIVGIYGVIAYSVSQRTREIGIRMALGAQRQTLTKMFVRQGLMLTGIGVACGLVAAFATMRLMSSLLFKVSPVDPITYAGDDGGRGCGGLFGLLFAFAAGGGGGSGGGVAGGVGVARLQKAKDLTQMHREKI